MNSPSFNQTLESARLLAEAQRRHAAGDAVAAEGAYAKLLKSRPNDVQLLRAHGQILTSLSRIGDARAALNKAIRIKPDDALLRYDLAMTYRLEGRFDEAQRNLDVALRHSPGDPTIISAKAGCYFIAGDIAASYAAIKPLVDSGEPHMSVALAFSRVCHRFGRETDAISLLRACLTRTDLRGVVRADAMFFLGELLDRIGEHDQAFAAFAEANQLRGTRFDSAAFVRSMDQLIRAWSPATLQQLPRSAMGSNRPVFILGMPRSGTTLVEQILASHPEVFGAGELSDITRQVRAWQGERGDVVPVLSNLEPLEQKALDRAAREYVDRLTRLAPRAKRITDKMPLNFLHLGVISLLFPTAHVIHCVRDPLDTCLSCYFHNFARQNSFTNDLATLGLFHGQYQRVMTHWRQTIDIPMLDVVYEDLVNDQERLSRQMIEFIGLPWNDACLRFHETKRVALTLSNDQVRRPMYRSSMQRWRHYERHLGPLQEALSRRC